MSSLTPVQLESLAQEIANRVADRLENRPRLVNRQDLSQITGLSVATIDRRRKEGKIPEIKDGNRVLFDLEAVILALTSGEDCGAAPEKTNRRGGNLDGPNSSNPRFDVGD